MRTREAMLWELEEKQIHEKHQLSKRHVKDICFMQRHQMIVRHEKELEQVKRMLQRKEEELIKRQTVERRALPKRIRNERKARDLMFRESLRISTNIDPDAEREKLKKVKERIGNFSFHRHLRSDLNDFLVPRTGEEEIHPRAATVRNETCEAIGRIASNSRRDCTVCST